MKTEKQSRQFLKSSAIDITAAEPAKNDHGR
jgi:hypothetical protein